ncbi:homeobox-leucine zipper protein HDG6-like isoform X4 [Brassica napus]|uniref:(rape) hypothetical protein n=3 Tax=Brassica napus TaxID=3708 RepID=A0A816XRN8_BRANA|nr:homeobox-leucine zipper protein HDG6-like isoform X4 [Brassica napus]CAF2149855.1 unnamed protein product [Brassica napus]
MNGQEDDYDDVFRYISSPSFMGIAEDDENNDTMGTTFGAGDQDGGNTIRNIMPIPQQNQEPENIYQEFPHPMGTQARVDDIQRAPVERDSSINDLLVSLSSPLGNALPAYDSFVDDDVLDIPAPPSSPTLMLNPGSDLSTELGPMINDRSTSMVNPHDTQPGNDAPQDKVDCGGETSPININSLLELADIAMNELIMLGEVNSPSWIIDSTSKRVTLDYQEYKSFFKNGFEKPPGYVIEASRETGTVHMECLPLVKTFTTDNWINVFAPIVPVTSIHNLIPKDSGGLRSGSLRLITAEFQVISPLVPKRQVKFLRYCKMLREGFWVVVDFTPRQENMNFSSDDGSYRLPSGVIIEDCGNGYSEVKWIEQIEYDENLIPQLPELLISSRIGLGAKRWFTTLQRHCENISTLASINLDEIYPGLSSKVATEIVKLAQRMTINYYLCITASPASIWKSNDSESARQDIRVMIRKNNVGEHTRIVLSAATSLWLPVSKKTAFDFLINPSFRNQWDILAIDVTTSIEEKIKIQKSRFHRNEVSLLQIEPGNSVLQETWNDASGALLVYAPVDMEKILASENSDSVQILPSGFSILPDGGGETDPNRSRVGCLLTLGYQMLHSVKPTEDVDQDFVKKVELLMDRTMGKIKSALSR